MRKPKPTDKKLPVLEQAAAIISGPRRASYGHPQENFTTTAAMWQAYLRQRFSKLDACEIELKPRDVAHLLGLLKYARLANDPNHADSLLDIAGYVGCAELCHAS